MDLELLHKAIVNRWFAEFWGEQSNMAIVDELASADVVLEYSMTGPLRGRGALKRFIKAFREAFPDLRFERDGPWTADRDIE
jgi:SnoaL-like polyketide cyclase